MALKEVRKEKIKVNLHANHRSRMRNRFDETSGTGFEDHELLEFLLFHSIPRVDTNDKAHLLLQKFGTLEGVLSASKEELVTVDGIGENSANLIKIAFQIHRRMLLEKASSGTFTSYDEVGEYLKTMLSHVKTETVILVLFDKRGRINRTATVSTGDSDKVMVNMKNVLSVAISKGAVTAAIAHNHPGGVLKPSYEDKVITLQISELLQSVGVKLLDHYIITEDGYTGVIHNKFPEDILEI